MSRDDLIPACARGDAQANRVGITGMALFSYSSKQSRSYPMRVLGQQIFAKPFLENGLLNTVFKIIEQKDVF